VLKPVNEIRFFFRLNFQTNTTIL